MARLVKTLLVAFVAAVMIAMAFVVAIAAPAAAGNTWTPTPEESVKVTAGAWFISDNAGLPDHECHIGVVGMYDLKKEEWRGQGSFMDKDFADGKLKAILTIDDGEAQVNDTGVLTGTYKLYGDARVSIDQELVGECPFKLLLQDFYLSGYITIKMEIDLPGDGLYEYMVRIIGLDPLSGGTVVSH
jgi:hypothetical protein